MENKEEDVIITPELQPVPEPIAEPVPACPDCTCDTVGVGEPIVTNIEDTITPNDEVVVEPIQREEPILSLGEYFGTLQESVTTIWKYHLSTRKHYIHVELDALYHMMLGLVDRLIETYQGCIVAVLEPEQYVNTLFMEGKDEMSYLLCLRNFVVEGRNKLFVDQLTEVWSTIDDILNALDSTIYKLNAFKEEPVKTFEAFCYENYSKLNEEFEDESENEDEEE